MRTDRPDGPLTQGSPMLDTFLPLLEAARGIDLADPQRARAELNRRFDPHSRAAAELNRGLVDLMRRGLIANRGELPVKWGRVTKAAPESFDFSIDVVHMTGPGPEHRHPEGEINYCVALAGQPTFDGEPDGWVVKPRDSTHVPTVAGGSMLIVYLLPRGAIEFTK